MKKVTIEGIKYEWKVNGSCIKCALDDNCLFLKNFTCESSNLKRGAEKWYGGNYIKVEK
jgi:hypothetical protein